MERQHSELSSKLSLLPLASILSNMCLKALPEATFAWTQASTRLREQRRCKERTAARRAPVCCRSAHAPLDAWGEILH